MDKPYKVGEDVYVLPTSFPIPGIGVLPINAFLLLAKEPVLVDSGVGIFKKEFMAAVTSLIDPSDIKWVWLTHDDIDHTGAIEEVMQAAPNATLLTHPLCALRMSAGFQIPLQRVHALKVGDSFEVGDRRLTAVLPPLFDNPMSIGLYDDRSKSFFSVDSFGAILGEAVTDASEVPEEALVQGMTAWATFDSPWTQLVDKNKFGAVLQRIRQVDADTIFSSHLPPARGVTERLLKVLEAIPDAPPFVPPDQAAYEQIVKALGPPPQ